MNTKKEGGSNSVFKFEKKTFLKGVHFLFLKLIAPKSEQEDLERREFILNVLLLGAIFLSGVLSLFVLHSLFFNPNYSGISFKGCFFVFCFFCFLLFLSRKGKFVGVSYVFIFSLFFPTAFTAFKWGADVPLALLSFAMIIIFSGILVSTRFSFRMAIFIFVTIFSITYLQLRGIIETKIYWKLDSLYLNDAVEFGVVLLIIAIVTWLSNRETEKSLKRARRSEEALKKERDSLERKVEERTLELQKAQVEKVRQLYRFAEFGRLSSGLFHDLSNHLAAFFLNLEKVNPQKGKEAQEAKKYLGRARLVMHKTEDFIDAVKKQLRQSESQEFFSLNAEVRQVIQVFEYRAKKAGVKILFNDMKEVKTFGNLIGFNQIVTNLLSNAVDACEKIEETEKTVEITLDKRGEKAFLSVKDSGCGIEDEIKEEIFKPLFTTKEIGHGIGIGLSSTKEIVTKSFSGEIILKDSVDGKTEFVVTFPIRKK